MTLTTYKGANIISLPARPGPKQIELGKTDLATPSRSLFTQVTQIQSWPGGDFWDASVTLPQMISTDARVWSAFLSSCRGIRNVFYLGDSLRKRPIGSAKGVPVVSGVQAASNIALSTKGWAPNEFRLLMPGDLLQLGTHLHEVLEQVNSDANGNATFDIWPSLREVTVDSDPIVLNNPKGLFRLIDNRRSIMSNETLLSAVSLRCIEAR